MLVDVHKLTKTELDNYIRAMADEVKRCMRRCDEFSDYINGLSGDDLTALGYDAATQAYIGSFRVALRNMDLMYRNQAKVGTDDPSYFIGLMASPLI